MSDRGGFDPAFEFALQKLIAASGGRLKVASGYRSTARQQQLWDAAVKKYGSPAAARKWVAPPGKSKHQSGLAADLSGDLAWAHANAARFGIYFPLKNENWHAELAGSRDGDSTSITYDPANNTGPGDPASLADLAREKNKTIEAQLAHLMAAISTPADRAF